MQTIEQTYPNITVWLQIGWIEIGYAHAPYLDSFIRVLDEGGMIWDGEADYESLDQALAAAEAAIAEWLGVNMPDSAIAIEEPPEFTAKQGQYLAFIHNFTQLNGRAPAEAEMQRYFEVTPPSVHKMVIRLEENGLIARTPGQARSIRLLVQAELLPALDRTLAGQ